MNAAVVRPLLVLAAVIAVTSSGCGASDTERAALAHHHGPYTLRGLYDRDQSHSGFAKEAALGFTMIDSGPYRSQLRPLAARGLKAFVWLGGYSNTSCRFVRDDRWIRSHVGAVAGNPAIAAYFIDDEPDAERCPTAPEQIYQRSRLVKSIDPRPVTFIAAYKVDQFALFAGATDVMALDHYPCSVERGCRMSIIDAEAAEADRLGIRYWGVIQAHGDEWYKVPTPAELHAEFEHWRATNMSAYLVFAWHWPPENRSLWLQNNRPLQKQLALENGG